MPDRWLFSILLIIVGIERFLIEFIRNTTPSPIAGLSVAQVIAIIFILIGLFLNLNLAKSKDVKEKAS